MTTDRLKQRIAQRSSGDGVGSRDLHFEPYVHLAGLSHDCALISWGGFFFRPNDAGGPAKPPRGQDHSLVDDDDLVHLRESRKDSIGERSRSYGPAVVRARNLDGTVAAETSVQDVNHAWLDGLKPDTEYCYEVLVEGQSWIGGHRFDWAREGDHAGLRRSTREYTCRFRTHPDPDSRAPLTFAVVGDFGIGIAVDNEDGRRQAALAKALDRAVSEHGVRLVLTTGDNIYLPDGDDDASGDEDDDWFFSFYQPYRYILDRVPFYPAVGNHDSSETERSDDRDQLDDNFFLKQRFVGERDASRASVDPGLFYRFNFGAAISFVCLDTTHDDETDACYFEREEHAAFLDESFPVEGRADEKWRIPFSHHPTFCAGPHHRNTKPMVKSLVPLFERAGVRLALAGHEHNFQYSRHNDVHYIVSGAGGQLRPERPSHFDDAHTAAWAAVGHFLIVSIDGDQATVTVLTAGDDGVPHPVTAETPDGEPFRTPIRIGGTG